MTASTRWFGWIALISMAHMAEQLLFGLDELDKIKVALAGYYAWFGSADVATVLLVTLGLGLVSLLAFCLLVGGRARFAALVVFNITALLEVHHVIESIAAGGYTPGVVTAIPYMVGGIHFLRALIPEFRAEQVWPAAAGAARHGAIG